MKIKTNSLIALLILTAGLTTGWAKETNWFVNAKLNGNWNNPENWKLGKLPDGTQNIRMNRGTTLLITNTMTVGAFQCGANGSSEIIVDGGSLNAVSPRDLNCAGNNNSGSLTIKNGGSVTVANYFLVGKDATSGSRVTIYEGTLRVARTYHHNKFYTGTSNINTRTTIYTGGTLDVEKLRLNAGVMNIAGGTVIIRAQGEDEILPLIENGRIIAMGGVDGWKIKITRNEDTGWLQLIAEGEAILLGTSLSSFVATLAQL